MVCGYSGSECDGERFCRGCQLCCDYEWAGRSSSGQNLFARASDTTGGGSGSLATAITEEEYFSFTINVDPGLKLGLTSLDLNAGFTRSGGFDNKTFTASLLTSVNGFTSSDLVDSISINTGTTDQFTPLYQAWSIDLNGVDFQDLTGSVEFRIYFHDDTGDTNNIHRLDDVVLNGTVTAASLQITDIVRDSETGDVSITWNSLLDEQYFVERSTDFLEWEEVDDPTDEIGTTTSEDTAAPDSGKVFYRVRR